MPDDSESRDRKSGGEDPRQLLLRQMRALRAGLDPAVVERLELAKQGKVPYDHATAQEAVRQFLASKQDGGKFRTRLMEALRKPRKD
ncbi:hypothetical protein [Arenibaculum pallidiluteum]|uniref:hypothetical protein n=1 Tax=Arenibaculum pallidiluteum TaxID=2812559 RepID=UPI001A970E03|nr:hypothetical protein [Arenibaculum pallidiluteum]